MTQYQQLIHEYLDGSIEPYKENILFDELARESSLRREFQEQMALHRTAASDMAAISTPAELGNEVFAAIGISTTPFADVPAKTIASNRSFKTWTSIFTGMFAIVVLYFLTARTENSFKENPDNSSAVSAKNSVPKTGNESQIQPENTIVNSISENDLLKENPDNIFAANNSFKNISFKSNSIKNKSSESQQNSDETAQKNNEDPTRFFTDNFTGIYFVNTLPSNPYSLKTNSQQKFSTQTIPDFIGDLLKTYSLTAQVTPITSDFKNLNFTGAIFYNYSPVDKFGVEAGRENFEVNSTQSINGVLSKTTQITPGATVGVVYRRLLPQIAPWENENFVPFAQLYIGVPFSGDVTVLNKITGGVTFKASDRMYVILGGEYAVTPLLSKQYNSRTQLTLGAGMNF